MLKALTRVFGSRNERLVKRLRPRGARLGGARGADFRAQRRRRCAPRPSSSAPGSPTARTLDDLQPEAFALVREAAQRVLKMRHFDVQLIGGLALHQGKIAEMRTGEGKTLVATLPAYLNALTGAGRARGHRQRVPRAARRRLDGPDLQVPRPHGRASSRASRTRPRSAPPTPATSPSAPTTNSASTTCATTWPSGSRTACSGRLSYAIIDEVDSILIDEARTPLIISGPAEESTEVYQRINTAGAAPQAPGSRGRARAISPSTRRASRST